MQKELRVEFDENGKVESFSSTEGVEPEKFSQKKRKRGPRGHAWSQKEEEKILKYALKLSQKEYQNNKMHHKDSVSITKYSEIEDVSVFYATETDFQNPLEFFDRIWQETQDSTGIVKIIPPQKWVDRQKENFKTNNLPKFLDPTKKLVTRRQTLNELYTAKKFDHSKEYNYEEYASQAEEISKTVYAGKQKPTIEKIEEDYWFHCSENSRAFIYLEPLTVLYAADVPTNKYFSKQEIDKLMEREKSEGVENFDLLNSNSCRNSFLQFMTQNEEEQISGITLPWFYFGMLYSTFCWHTEDLYLYSLNYMHEGAPKIWYSISHTQKKKMDEYIKNKYFATCLKQPDLVHRLTVHVSPLELIKNGINVYRAVQNPGEMIVTLPKGYHCGFSTGLNFAEAVNFSTLKWVDYGLKAQIDYKKNNRKLPVFSMEWIIMQNYENLDISKFDDPNYKHKIKEFVNSIASQEIEMRNSLQVFFKSNKINYIIEEMDKNDVVEKFDCDFCTFSGFLSQLHCNNCNKKSCLAHSIQCKCLPTNFILRVRYLTKDLQAIKAKKV